MTGIVIFTASRDDAYQDYLRSVKQGVEGDEISPYLSDEKANKLIEEDDDTIRVWGTTVESQWEKIEPNDIVLIYRKGKFVARARTVLTSENLELAAHLWKREENPWDEDNPWRYLVFVDHFEEVDVPVEKFNSLVGYDEDFIPNGFMRVADRKIEQLLETHDSVENAIADLTGTGEKIHRVKPDDDDEDSVAELQQKLREAGSDGSRGEEFERLVADAFGRLGCSAQWIEGGSDTDVEITTPLRTVVEVKSTSRDSGIRNINAAGIVSHRDQRDAEHAIVVGPHFPPRAIEDAERHDITILTTDLLIELLDLRLRYGIPPERVFEFLSDPGPFDENHLDLLQEHLEDRRDAMAVCLSVLKGLERSARPLTAEQLHYILLGMTAHEDVPEVEEITHTLQLLSHPVFQLLDQTEDGYTLSTNFENAVEVISTLPALVDEVGDEIAESEEE